MNLKVVLVVVFLSALAITSTKARIPSCCIGTQIIPRRLILKAERWERQSSIGICDIDALKLYVQGRKKPFCLPSYLEGFLENMKRQQTKRT